MDKNYKGLLISRSYFYFSVGLSMGAGFVFSFHDTLIPTVVGFIGMLISGFFFIKFDKLVSRPKSRGG